MKIKFIKPFRFIGNAPDDGSDSEVPVGHIVDLENDESTQWLIDNGFAEKVDEGVEWLYDGIPYYEPAVSGIARKFVPSYDEYWGDDVHDEARRRIGICYKSRAACQRFIDFLTAVETVRHDEGFMKYNKTCCEVWELRRLHPDANGLFTAHKVESEFLHDLGAFYFDTEEHAKASVKKHPKEWGTIMNYDWSKGEDEEEDD